MAKKHEGLEATPASEREYRIYYTFMVIFCCAIIISNVLAAKTLSLGFLTLPASILTFPIVYILNDMLSDVFGFKKARRVIIAGFIGALSAATAFQVTILLPGIEAPSTEAFSQALGNSWRILLGSFASYLAGGILNAFAMTRLKKRFENCLFFRCIFSTILGESVDSMIFITVAFAGIYDPVVIVTMIGSQISLKSLYEVIAYPATKKIINHVRKSLGKSVY